jgi:hypothetical protein
MKAAVMAAAVPKVRIMDVVLAWMGRLAAAERSALHLEIGRSHGSTSGITQDFAPPFQMNDR